MYIKNKFNFLNKIDSYFLILLLLKLFERLCIHVQKEPNNIEII
jgi:hypothetical protein